MNFDKIRNTVLAILKEKLPENLYFHSIEHTKTLAQDLRRIVRKHRISADDVKMLKTAAIFYFIGYIYPYEQHHDKAVELGRKLLPQYGYSEKNILLISGMIYATQNDRQPMNQLEEIFCSQVMDLPESDVSNNAQQSTVEVKTTSKKGGIFNRAFSKLFK